MALLWAGGAELQSAAANVEFTAIVNSAPVIETTIKRSGAAAWRISNTGAVEGFRQAYTAAQGSFFFQFYLYIVALPTDAAFQIMRIGTTGAAKITIRLTSGGELQLFNFEDTAQVGTNSSALSTATWYRIAVNYDSTTLNATTVEARAYADTPGASAFWNPSGTIDITPTPTNFAFQITTADATLDYIVDDVTINDTVAGGVWDTWPPENKLNVLRPNANGDNSVWVGSDGNSTDNYLLINEVPPSATEYVQAQTSGEIDDYNMEATSSEIGAGDTINAVMVGGYAAASATTSADPDIVWRIKPAAAGTTDETATLDVNSVTFHAPSPLPAGDNYTAIGNGSNYEQPGGASAWTKATLDTMQIGVRVSATDATDFARVGAMWAYVSFTPAAGGGDTELVVADVDHAHTADTSALTQAYVLTVADVTHASGAENVALEQAYLLAVADAAHAHTADAPTLTQAYVLAVADATHVHTADAPALTQAYTLTVADAGHVHTSDNVTISPDAEGDVTLTVADAEHLHAADGVALVQGYVLAVADATHSHTANTLALVAQHVLTVGDAAHAHTAETVVLDFHPLVTYLYPGTRDVRRAAGRGELLSDAPGRARARAREPIESEG